MIYEESRAIGVFDSDFKCYFYVLRTTATVNLKIQIYERFISNSTGQRSRNSQVYVYKLSISIYDRRF